MALYFTAARSCFIQVAPRNVTWKKELLVLLWSCRSFVYPPNRLEMVVVVSFIVTKVAFGRQKTLLRHDSVISGLLSI